MAQPGATPWRSGWIQIWNSRVGAGLAIVLGMHDAGAGVHHLHVARGGPALVAEIVAMGDGALADIGDDLHLAVRMRVEAGIRRDLVIVPDAQPAEAHALRVVVLAEAEVMPGVEPLVAKAAETGEGSNLDHGGFSWIDHSISNDLAVN